MKVEGIRQRESPMTTR